MSLNLIWPLWAIKKKTKIYNGTGAIAPQGGDAWAGSRTQFKRSHCDTSMRYQRHLRGALFPDYNQPNRAKLQLDTHICGVSCVDPEDLIGLKIANEAPASRQVASPSIFQALPAPLRTLKGLSFSLPATRTCRPVMVNALKRAGL